MPSHENEKNGNKEDTKYIKIRFLGAGMLSGGGGRGIKKKIEKIFL